MESNFLIRFITGILTDHDLELPLGKFSLGEGGDVWVKFQTAQKPLISLNISEKGVALEEWNNTWINGLPASYWQEKSGLSEKLLPLSIPIDLDGVGLVILPKGDKSAPSTFTLPVRQSLNELTALARSSEHHSLGAKEIALGISWSLGLLLILFGGWLVYKKFYPDVVVDVMAQTTQWLQEEQSKDQFSDLSFTLLPNGEVVVSGGCWDSKDLNRLYAQLRSRGWLVRSSVVCNDELIKSVEYTLRLFRFDDAIVSNGETLGSIHISGAIKGDGNWQKVEDLLIKMPGLVSWTVSNDAQGQATLLMQLLSEQHFSNPLDFSQKNNKILVTGRLNSDEQARLKGLFSDVRAQFPNNEFIYQNIDAISPDLNVWPSPVVGIGGNKKTPFVELSNGLRLQLGSKLPSGYQIIGIDATLGIRLMMQGKVINVPIDFNV